MTRFRGCGKIRIIIKNHLLQSRERYRTTQGCFLVRAFAMVVKAGSSAMMSPGDKRCFIEATLLIGPYKLEMTPYSGHDFVRDYSSNLLIRRLALKSQ
jgi:hypothetical protein